MLCTAGGAERSHVAQNFAKFLRIFLFCPQALSYNVLQLNSVGYILTIYLKTTITIITKLLRWDHRVVHNVPTKFKSCRFNSLGGVGLQRNTIKVK